MPRRSVTPGRKPSTMPSERSTRSSTSDTASGFFRSIPTDGRDRLRRSQYGPCPEFLNCSPASTAPGAARSSRSTEAPASASIMQVKGPGPIPASSMILIPCSGPLRSVIAGSCPGIPAPVKPGPMPRRRRHAAPSWGRAHCPRTRPGHHHRRPHRLQRRSLAPHGHRPGHRGAIHPQAGELPRRRRVRPVPRRPLRGPTGRPGPTGSRSRRTPSWRPGSCVSVRHRTARAGGSR